MVGAAAAGGAGGKGPRTRLAQAFGKMVVACPQQIRAYGACIAAKLEGAQGVERGACEAEFSAVRACFQQQLKAGRGARGKA